MKNICIITSSRADFDLLYHTLYEIKNSDRLNLQLIVTGSHLLQEHGYTVKDIEEHGFSIDYKIKLRDESDSAGVVDNFNKTLKEVSLAIKNLKPHLFIVLGDRYEICAAALSAFINNIPLAHIHGGEVTLSAQDDAMRHSISKMSSLHFVANKIYKKRVIQLGEKPSTVNIVGALGAERIKKISIFNREDLQKKLDFELKKENVIVTYHPETLKKGQNKRNFQELLQALERRRNLGVIFTSPNMDAEAFQLKKLIKLFIKRNPERSIFYSSMGAKLYFSTLHYVDCVLGNSSSGMIEAPILGVPTINVGDRQTGRVLYPSILNCEPAENKILESIDLAISSKFKKKALNSKNKGQANNSSKIIYNKLLSYNYSDNLLKGFYDL